MPTERDRERATEWLADNWPTCPDYHGKRDSIADLIAAVRREENEACEKVCRKYAEKALEEGEGAGYPLKVGAEACAARIRARRET